MKSFPRLNDQFSALLRPSCSFVPCLTNLKGSEKILDYLQSYERQTLIQEFQRISGNQTLLFPHYLVIPVFPF